MNNYTDDYIEYITDDDDAFEFLTPRESDRPYTVSEINSGISRILEERNTLVWVAGEISGWKSYPSGHCYFKLKDEGAQIPGVMWKSSADKLDFAPRDNMAVFAVASISVYAKGGYYQLNVHKLTRTGEGALHLAFEKLKKKLLKEGLFDEGRKRPLPRSVSTVGVITSKQGAALWDIARVIASRAPQTNIVFIDTPVQGDHAAAKIATNIRAMNAYNKSLLSPATTETQTPLSGCEQINIFEHTGAPAQTGSALGRIDVMIVGRGGGSIEDLQAFNEEAVARAIYESEIPVISAVGHEIDFTIADFTADLRAPTPSAAAETAVPDTKDEKRYYDQCVARFARGINGYFASINDRVRKIKSSRGMTRPVRVIRDAEHGFDDAKHRFGKNIISLFNSRGKRLQALAGRLNALSPLATLRRGYSVVTDNDGATVKNVGDVGSGDLVNIRLSDGNIGAKII